jgi:ferredoxin-NADP reductase
MAERGATPKVPKVRRKALGAVRSFFSPLLPDDYLELINPLWSTQELRGRIESVDREAGNATTVTIKPGHKWEGHQPGQYLRVGVVVDGVHHWRAYSLTSEPDRPDGYISITPKLVPEGKVSPHFVEQAEPGVIVRLGGVEGSFVMPDPVPEKILFISAGSGITPIMSMLRDLIRREKVGDVVHLHSDRTPDDVIFGEQLREFDRTNDSLSLHIQLTGEHGRITPDKLDEMCPDWRERVAFVSGPAEMLDAMEERWEADGDPDLLHMERFQPKIGGGEEGEGGTIKFLKSDKEAKCDGGTPVLVAGEEAGIDMPFGCREGICHTCIGKLCTGKVRDMRNGQIHGTDGEMIRTCINAPEGDIEIEL